MTAFIDMFSTEGQAALDKCKNRLVQSERATFVEQRDALKRKKRLNIIEAAMYGALEMYLISDGEQVITYHRCVRCSRRFRLTDEEISIWQGFGMKVPERCRKCRYIDLVDDGIAIDCISCRDSFILEAREISWYQRKGLDLPKRCGPCREKKQEKNIYLPCKDCGRDFRLETREALWFRSKGFPLPKRCKPCRKVKREYYRQRGF